MTESTSPYSLLNVLSSPASGARLTISVNPNIQKADLFPFVTCCDDNPVAYLLEAKLVLAEADKTADIYLFLERDEYLEGSSFSSGSDEIVRQISALARSAEGQNATVAALGFDAPDSSVPAVFPPVFHCACKDLYFQPVCPDCGRQLTQAVIKELPELLRVSLRPQQRYLCCASCVSSGQGESFYVKRRKQGDADVVKDCQQLVGQWKNLFGRLLDCDGFPCINCPDAAACFGPDGLSQQRLTPLSFYNFHFSAVESASFDESFYEELSGKVGVSDGAIDTAVVESISQASSLPDVDENKAICEILQDIRSRWLEKSGTRNASPVLTEPAASNELSEKAAVPVDLPDMAGDFAETVILNPFAVEPSSTPAMKFAESAKSESHAAMMETVIMIPESEDKQPAASIKSVPGSDTDLLATVIMGSSSGKLSSVVEKPTASAGSVDFLAETQILNRFVSSPPQEISRPTEAPILDEGFAETVILNPSVAAPPQFKASQSTETDVNTNGLAETCILRPGDGMSGVAHPACKPADGGEMDSLLETVIIRPAQGGKQKR